MMTTIKKRGLCAALLLPLFLALTACTSAAGGSGTAGANSSAAPAPAAAAPHSSAAPLSLSGTTFHEAKLSGRLGYWAAIRSMPPPVVWITSGSGFTIRWSLPARRRGGNAPRFLTTTDGRGNHSFNSICCA